MSKTYCYAKTYSKMLVFKYLLTNTRATEKVLEVLKVYRTSKGQLLAKITYKHSSRPQTIYTKTVAINEDQLIALKMNQVILDSKSVQFIHQGVTSKHHSCSANHCTCNSFSDKDYGVKLGGYSICKHTIAYAKQYLGIGNAKDYANFLYRWNGENHG